VAEEHHEGRAVQQVAEAPRAAQPLNLGETQFRRHRPPDLHAGTIAPLVYGPGDWVKRKGIARVRLPDGTIRLAEVHSYEAHGVGRKELKVKRLVD
jgi:hypothetical protein